MHEDTFELYESSRDHDHTGSVQLSLEGITLIVARPWNFSEEGTIPYSEI
jgi:hypothetical protein